MRTRFVFLLVWAFLFVGMAVAGPGGKSKKHIAVMDLGGNGVAAADLAGLTNRLRTELFRTGQFSVVERSRVDEILKEQGFQQTGCTNTDCAVEVGQLVGVEEIVLGSIDKVGTIYTADVRYVLTEKYAQLTSLRLKWTF